MLSLFHTALLALFAAGSATAAGKTRKITVTNACDYTVWPGLFTSEGPMPAQPGGWEAKPGSSVSFTVQETWGGRIWPRTNCDFSDKSVPGYLACETGGCNGGLVCAPVGGTGVIPSTLAEFNFQKAVDFYDTSVVDGFNVPLAITSSSKKCKRSNCPYDLLSACPRALQKKNGKGKVIGCLTDCAANPQNSEYCCFGEHNTLASCPASGVPHLKWWKAMCPGAYAYAYDDATSLYPCSDRADYTITFCPSTELYSDAVCVLCSLRVLAQKSASADQDVARCSVLANGASAPQGLSSAAKRATSKHKSGTSHA
ncbi:hypothetical protein JCM10908_005262 [Rhodotorula pacifica]|uniref:thaumatin family protein n=1 Tax=Rhodotorula pacifica TaxID=1495444 RepID=UPI00317911F4